MAQSNPIRINIGGMTCATCAGRVERALSEVSGVGDVSVNYAVGSATILSSSAQTDTDDLLKAVENAGYRAHVVDGVSDQSADRALEEQQARQSMLVSTALALPVFITEMGGHLIPAFHHLLHATVGQNTIWTAQFVLTSLVLLWPGRGFFLRGFPALFRGEPDMNSLVALGASAAWGFSTLSLFGASLLPPGTRAVYFEAAAIIVTLILVGRWLEAHARGRTGAAIERLISLQPTTALVERNGTFEVVPLTSIQPDDLLLVKPGARVPVDGMIEDGNSYVDESMISGESLPIEKEPGTTVIGGTVNGEGVLRMRATRVGHDTMLAQIIEMVQHAQGERLPVQALADRVVRVFVPAVLMIALGTITLWMMLGPDPALGHALVAGVSVLIIACPCAMGLATPTSIMVGTGRAAELGVLFRKGSALQRLDEVKVLAFDKTGTLTVGKPKLVRIETVGAIDRSEVLRLTASAEVQSEHPIARALIEAAQEDGLKWPEATSVKAVSGFGLAAKVDGQDILIGAERLMIQSGIDTKATAELAEEIAQSGETPIYAALDGTLAAILSVRDAAKPSAKDTIRTLRAQGVEVAMITGDTEATARAIAVELGIDHVMAEVLPGGKRDVLQKLRSTYGSVGFVGDGINDAPALAEADVGIALGSGTDVAIEAADVVLMSDELNAVVIAWNMSQQTMRNIRQNLFWAFSYNVALIPVAAGLLYPISGLLLSPMLAAAAMALSSVFVVTNALRLRNAGPNQKTTT